MAVKYDVKVPALTGMKEPERSRAIEDYMRENGRVLRLIFRQLQEEQHVERQAKQE